LFGEFGGIVDKGTHTMTCCTKAGAYAINLEGEPGGDYAIGSSAGGGTSTMRGELAGEALSAAAEAVAAQGKSIGASNGGEAVFELTGFMLDSDATAGKDGENSTTGARHASGWIGGRANPSSSSNRDASGLSGGMPNDELGVASSVCLWRAPVGDFNHSDMGAGKEPLLEQK
jgi:hypothetical protein